MTTTTDKNARQGDVPLVRVPAGKLPAGLRPAPPEGGRLILARGEATGHHHSVAAREGVTLFRPDDAGAGGCRYLLVEGEPAVLEHQEHDPITLPPGLYRLGRQVERTPQAVRQVQD